MSYAEDEISVVAAAIFLESCGEIPQERQFSISPTAAVMLWEALPSLRITYTNIAKKALQALEEYRQEENTDA